MNDPFNISVAPSFDNPLEMLRTGCMSEGMIESTLLRPYRVVQSPDNKP